MIHEGKKSDSQCEYWFSTLFECLALQQHVLLRLESLPSVCYKNLTTKKRVRHPACQALNHLKAMGASAGTQAKSVLHSDCNWCQQKLGGGCPIVKVQLLLWVYFVSGCSMAITRRICSGCIDNRHYVLSVTLACVWDVHHVVLLLQPRFGRSWCFASQDGAVPALGSKLDKVELDPSTTRG